MGAFWNISAPPHKVSKTKRSFQTSQDNTPEWMQTKSLKARFLPTLIKTARQSVRQNARHFSPPFGSNLSQQKALAAALTNQISVIQGPPGTGKTQTILNITANLLYQNKKVAIVSNNNAATQNVLQKLQEAGLGGVCAMLGRRSNKQEFLQNQRPNLASLKDLAASLEAKFADKAALGEFFKQGEERLGRLNEELKQLLRRKTRSQS